VYPFASHNVSYATLSAQWCRPLNGIIMEIARSVVFRAQSKNKFCKNLGISCSKPRLEGINWRFLGIHDEAFKLNVDFGRVEHHVRRGWILFEV
jgi:hypothetical protein